MIHDISMMDYLAMCNIECNRIDELDNGNFLIAVDGMTENWARKKIDEAGYVVHAVFAHTPTETLYIVIGEKS